VKLLATMTALLVAGMLTAVAVAGPQSAFKKKPLKVTMCHLTNAKRLQTVRVNPRSVRALLRAGYKRGACPKQKTKVIIRTVTVTVTATPTSTTTTGTTTGTSTSSSTTGSTTTGSTTTGSTTTGSTTTGSTTTTTTL
jgi:hypothetical protein